MPVYVLRTEAHVQRMNVSINVRSVCKCTGSMHRLPGDGEHGPLGVEGLEHLERCGTDTAEADVDALYLGGGSLADGSLYTALR